MGLAAFAGAAVRGQDGADAVPEVGAVGHQMEAEAGAPAQRAPPGSGTQIAGTSLRRESSASTQASIRSVSQAHPLPWESLQPS